MNQTQPAADKMTRHRQRLKAAGLMTEEDFQRLLQAADAEVQAAVEFAEAAEWEPVQELERHVLAAEGAA